MILLRRLSGGPAGWRPRHGHRTDLAAARPAAALAVAGCPRAPRRDAGRTIERPVVLAGRIFDRSRVDEVVASPHFMTAHHLRVGDTLTLHLSSPAQAAEGIDASQTPLADPRVRIVGWPGPPFPWTAPGTAAESSPDYALFTKYRADITGGVTERRPDLRQRPDPPGRRRSPRSTQTSPR